MSMNSRDSAQSLGADVAPAWIVANFVPTAVAGILMVVVVIILYATGAVDTNWDYSD